MLKFLLLLFLSVPLYANPHFHDATQEAGIGFVHVNGANGQKFVIETVGPGGGFFDYDGAGRLDIYLINGAAVPGTEYDPAPQNALYRNKGNGTFADVTEHTGVGDTGYGMGCAVGDIDNDGDLDLYATNFGANVLYRNEGDGTFADVTVAAQVGDEGWGASAAFADIDRDGFVDLYVGNYHNFSYANHRVCAEGGSGLQLYCGPEAFDGVPDVLYRNEGDGTFADITVAAGLGSAEGKELGVVFGDVDLDGDPDLYLANDKTLNFLYLNDGRGHFAEEGLLAGVAYNEDGDVEAGMGVDMGDYDNDGDPDLFVTNFQWETNTLYKNLGDGTFVDETFLAGLGKGSIAYLAWGTRFFDADNDGASGHYVRLRLEGRDSNRAGIGTRVEVASDGQVQTDEVRSGASFLSQSDLRLHLGLGAATSIERVVVYWPSGRVEEYADLGVNQEHLLVEGAAR